MGLWIPGRLPGGFGQTTDKTESRQVSGSKTSFQVEIADTGECFDCAPDQVVLNAMLALGRKGIPSGCHGGGCGICKIRVTSGAYSTGCMSREHVSEQEEHARVALACKVFPQTDLRVKVLGKMRKCVVPKRRYGFV